MNQSFHSSLIVAVLISTQIITSANAKADQPQLSSSMEASNDLLDEFLNASAETRGQAWKKLMVSQPDNLTERILARLKTETEPQKRRMLRKR